MDLPASGAQPDDGPLEGGVGDVELEVGRGVPGQRLIRGGHVVGSHEVRHSGQAGLGGEILVDQVRVDHPAEVDLAWPQPDHLPVEHGDRFEVVEHHVADPRVAPTQDRVALVGGPIGGQPLEAALDGRRGDPVVDHRELVPGSGMRDVTAQVRGAGVGELEERQRARGVVDRVQVGEHPDRRVLQPALLCARGVEEPTGSEVVGHVVGRDDPVDPAHHEERRAEHRRIVLAPQHVGHRHLAPFTDCGDRVELLLHVVGPEDRHVIGSRCDPGDEPMRRALPVGIEQDGLARHAGRRRVLERGDRHVGVHAGAHPRFERRSHLVAIATGPLDRHRCVGHTVSGTHLVPSPLPGARAAEERANLH